MILRIRNFFKSMEEEYVSCYNGPSISLDIKIDETLIKLVIGCIYIYMVECIHLNTINHLKNPINLQCEIMFQM